MNQHIKDIEAQLQEIDLVQLYNIRSVLEMEIDRKETIYRDEGICFECGTKWERVEGTLVAENDNVFL